VKDCGKTVAISVKDTGIGIQEDKLEMILKGSSRWITF